MERPYRRDDSPRTQTQADGSGGARHDEPAIRRKGASRFCVHLHAWLSLGALLACTAPPASTTYDTGTPVEEPASAGAAGSSGAAAGATAAGQAGAASGAGTTGGASGKGGQASAPLVYDEVVAARYTTCARRSDGKVKCWGANGSGLLGLGDMKNRGDAPGEMGDALPFVDLGTGARAIKLAVGDWHACALLEGGRIKCWGENSLGQLGLGDMQDRGDAPGEMGDALPSVDLGDVRAVDVAAGSDHTCALLEGGRVKCWGSNDEGGLGLGDTKDRGDAPGEMGEALPFVDLGDVRAVSVAAGLNRSCALLEEGRIKCWGSNHYGSLGLGQQGTWGDEPGEMGQALPFVNLGKGARASRLTVDAQHSCARLEGGQVKCWGYNGQEGALGLGDPKHRGESPKEMGDALPFVDLGAGASVVSLEIGLMHACALLVGGQVKCWGDGSAGPLGLGDKVSRGAGPGEMGEALPFVDLGARVRTVTAGVAHSCVLLEGGQIKCWGLNQAGQLGLGDTKNRGDSPGTAGAALPFVDLGAASP